VTKQGVYGIDITEELIVQPLKGIRVKPVLWRVPGWIPSAKSILLAGDGGVGKSYVTRHYIAKDSVRKPAFGLSYQVDEPGGTILFAEEDGYADKVIPHLLAEGADLDLIYHVPHVEVFDRGERTKIFFGVEHLPILKTELKKRAHVKTVVIDPIASLVGRAGVNEHKQAELRRVLDPLSDIADATGVTFILIAHLNKGTNTKAAYRVAGSAAYVSGVRLAYMLDVDPDDESRRLLLPIKTNLNGAEKSAMAFRLHMLTPEEGAACRHNEEFSDCQSDAQFAAVLKEMGRLEFEGNVDTTADKVMGAARGAGGDRGDRIGRCKAWLKEFLKEYAYPSTEITEAGNRAGHSADSIHKAKTQLKDEGLTNSSVKRFNGIWWSGFGHHNEWRLRPDPENPDIHDPLPQ
jgi:hypothetical protein